MTSVPGVSLDDLMRAYYLENNVCGPAECEPRIARLRRRRDDGAPFEIRLPDGRVMSMSVRPTSDGGTVMVRRDITAIRRAEEALRQREEHFRSLFELAPQGIIMHRDGVVLNANPAAAKIMKVASASDIAGQPISRFLPADEVAAAIKRGRDFIEHGTTEADIHEVKARRADGQMWSAPVQPREHSRCGRPPQE